MCGYVKKNRERELANYIHTILWMDGLDSMGGLFFLPGGVQGSLEGGAKDFFF